MSSESKQRTKHIDQSIPYEWRAVQWADKTFIVRDIPEGTAECFIVTSGTCNLRNLAFADAVIYNGNVVDPVYDDETGCIEFYHDFAGKKDSRRAEEWLDEPALRLKRLPSADLNEVTV